MRLSADAVSAAINHLRDTCHPFLGITFLASKAAQIPVGETKTVSLDGLTREHLREFHRLDEDSEFYFQPFKTTSGDKFWVDARYPSSGLQAINTQTFSDAFIHPPKSRVWGFADNYVEAIKSRLDSLNGYAFPQIAALAVWCLKSTEFSESETLEGIAAQFVEEFGLNPLERENLFEASNTFADGVTLFSSERVDLKLLSYRYDTPPDVPSEAQGALTSLTLEHVGPADRISLDFGERLTLIAGDNGLGKSFILDAAWWAITGSWVSKPAYPFRASRDQQPEIRYTSRGVFGNTKATTARFDWSTFEWHQADDREPISALTIYARVDGSFAVMDKVRGQVRVGRDSGVDLFTKADVWDGGLEIEGLVRDWVTWQNSDDGSFELLLRVLEHLSPEDIGPLMPGPVTRLPGVPRQIPTITHSYGDVPITLVSAGVRRVIVLAYLIIWVWKEHCLAASQVGVEPQRRLVVLVDELEAHLHPKWQRLVLPALVSVGKLLSEEIELQTIAATHSPMVLASIEPEFSEESDALLHLELNQGNVELEPLDFYKYGDMSSWLTSPVFGLSHARSQKAGKVIDRAKALQLSADPSKSDVAEITLELKKVLSSDDQFWNRWIFFANTLGVDV